MKLLYIDDSPMQHKIIKIYLAGQEGLEIISALNGKEGCDLAVKEIPDIILLDIEMPEMDGEKVLKSLKINSLTAKIPVVMFSSSEQPGLTEFFTGLGASAMLKKPHGISLLKTTISSILANDTDRAN